MFAAGMADPFRHREYRVETMKELNFSQRQRFARTLATAGAYAAAVIATAGSAVLVKEYRAKGGLPPALVALDFATTARAADMIVVDPSLEQPQAADETPAAAVQAEPEQQSEPAADEVAAVEPVDPLLLDPEVRWFNGRPVKPARTIMMTVTAYSPDARSCGDSADGITATLHSVFTNGFKLVAADPRLLPYGSMLTVPGYDGDQIVPVLDCGGKIKGRRLDVLFPTHEEAVKWGVRKVPVTVWKYVDGKPADNPRKFR